MNVNEYKVLNKLITGILLSFLKQFLCFYIDRLPLCVSCRLPIDRAELCILDFQLDRLSPLITGEGSGFAPNSGWSGKKAHHAYDYLIFFFKSRDVNNTYT
jgi:hypothetical protein